MYTDITLQIYFLIGIIATVGSGLFFYWMFKYSWYRSIVFIYVTILLTGEAIRAWICMWGRYTLIAQPGEFMNFTLSWVWSSRLLLSLVSVAALVGHMSYRALTKDSKDRRL